MLSEAGLWESVKGILADEQHGDLVLPLVLTVLGLCTIAGNSVTLVAALRLTKRGENVYAMTVAMIIADQVEYIYSGYILSFDIDFATNLEVTMALGAIFVWVETLGGARGLVAKHYHPLLWLLSEDAWVWIVCSFSYLVATEGVFRRLRWWRAWWRHRCCCCVRARTDCTGCTGR